MENTLLEKLLNAVDEYITYQTTGKLEDLIRVRKEVNREILKFGVESILEPK